jgi:hypothetical protein
MTYVPYETVSRSEAKEIAAHPPTALADLSPAQREALVELLADGVARGIEMGFAMSDFSGGDPTEPIEAYNAGIIQGKKET